LCQEGKVEEAEKLLGEVEGEGLVSDQLMYTSLVDGYSISGRLNLAFSLLKRMLDSGCKPNYRTYKVLMEGLHKDREVLEQKLAAFPDSVAGSGMVENAIDIDITSLLLLRLPEYEC